MSQIRSKNTKQEKLVFSELRKRRIYFQKHYSKVPGNPDIAIPSKKIAVFIHSDFWHGWRFPQWKYKMSDYWKIKIENNRKRDKKNILKLRKEGWRTLTIWEHDLKKDKEKTINKIVNFLKTPYLTKNVAIKSNSRKYH